MTDVHVTADTSTIQCKSCSKYLGADFFYTSNKSKCKECVKRDVRDNRRKRVDYYREYDKNRFQNDPRVRERHKRYQSTERGKKSMLASRQRWNERNSEKRKAHHAVNNAVRDGRLIKPETCQACGSKPPRIEGHHRDYTKPLDVMWLCRPCHVAEHNHFART